MYSAAGALRVGLLWAGVVLLGACGETPSSSQKQALPPKSSTELVTPPPKPEAAPRVTSPSTEPAAPRPRRTPVKPPVAAPPTQPPSSSAAAIPAKLLSVASFEVKGYPDKSATVEVRVEGRVRNGEVKCELADISDLVAPESKWLPLPINFYNPSNPDRRLAKAAHETMDFPPAQKRRSANHMSCLVEFVRGKIFRALWQVRTRKIEQNGKPACTAQLEICLYPEERDGVYQCTNEWRQILRLITVIDTKKHLFHFRSPEREKDDIYEMLFVLKKLSDGVPTGDAFEETFRGFVEQ